MGMDSLMAVELATVLRNDLAIEVPVVRLLKGITVSELAGIVQARLDESHPGGPAQAASARELPSVAEAPTTPPVDRPPAPLEAEPRATVAAMPVRETPRAPLPALPTDRRLLEWTPLQRVARAVVTGFTRAVADVRITGADNAPADGPFVIAANHVSMWDAPVLLCAADRPVIMFAADELRHRVLMHWTLHKIWNAIYLRRGEGDFAALEQAVDILRRGGRLGLSPEGHRSRAGLQQAFTGVAYLAHRAGVPTVPVAVYGQERIVESCRRLRRAPVTIQIGTPIPAPSGEATAEALRAHTERVMLAIARLLPPEYRGRYAEAVDAANGSVKEIA
jgi:1-acyl-sn-glycerol-3-phosphate acyltransferase